MARRPGEGSGDGPGAGTMTRKRAKKPLPGFTPGDRPATRARDLKRAEDFKGTRAYRGAVRGAYKGRDEDGRRASLKTAKGREGAAIRQLHGERERASDAVGAALKWAKAGSPGTKEAARKAGLSGREIENVNKGLRVLRRQHERLEAKNALLRALAKGASFKQLDRQVNEAGVGPVLAKLPKLASTVASTVGEGVMLNPGNPAAGVSRRAVARVGKVAPLSDQEKALIEGSKDGLSIALEQLNRGSSASAGAALEIAKGGHPNMASTVAAVAKGGAEGFVSNERSYREVAGKAGLHGTAATVVGLIGDIGLDPTTYLTLGAKAPAEVAEQAARRALARTDRKAARALLRREARGEDVSAARAALQTTFDRGLAEAEREWSKLSRTKGLQVGFRVPSVPTVRRGAKGKVRPGLTEPQYVTTKGRATSKAGEVIAPAAGRVQQQEQVNAVLRAFSPAQRPKGMSLEAWREYRLDVKRPGQALRTRVERDSTNLAKLIRRETDGNTAAMRRVVDAREAGTVDALPDALRATEKRLDEFLDGVAGRYSDLTGRELHMIETILPRDDVDDALGLARSLLAGRLKRAAGRGRSAEGDAARALDEAEEMAARIGDVERPMTIAEEHDLIARLESVVEDARVRRRGEVARQRANEHLAAVRRGGSADPALRAALDEETAGRTMLAAAKKAGDRNAVRLARKRAKDARATVKVHRGGAQARILDDITISGEPVLKGREAALEAKLKALAQKASYEPPAAYVPRQYDDALLKTFGKKQDKARIPTPVVGQSKAGFEQARIERRRLADVAADYAARGEASPYSDQLPLLVAKYGAVMGRRLEALYVYGQVIKRFTLPATVRNLADETMELARIPQSGQDAGKLLWIDDAAERQRIVNQIADGGEPGEFVVLPRAIARDLRTAWAGGEANAYDALLRTWKQANTIYRPGFFVMTFLGNFWQQFLADLSPADMARSWRILSGIRSHELGQLGVQARRKRLFDAVMPGERFTRVGGKDLSFADFFDLAIEHGVARTGSRFGDPAELAPERIAARRLGESLGRSRIRARGERGTEWLGDLSEDLDDMTRLAVFKRGLDNGMAPDDAANLAYTVMIDYTDLTRFERRVMKRVMPFYVFTARNLPIQVRRNLARPGKLATMEKVRQALAQESGLPADWTTGRSEGDQERFPVPTPGIKFEGRQNFQFLRLPFEDLSRPLQVIQGGEGVRRGIERYMGDVAPFLKGPIELEMNKRFDFDRPIEIQGAPPEAGVLLRAFGAGKGEYVDRRTGKKYEGVNAKLDYVLRGIFGSPGSAAMSIGRTKPDRSNVPTGIRVFAGQVLGQGMSSADDLDAIDLKLSRVLTKLYARQNDVEKRAGDGAQIEAEELQEKITQFKNLRTKVRATLGEQSSKDKLPGIREREIARILNPPLPPELRAMKRKLDRALDVLP